MLAGYLGNLRARHVRAADDKIHLSNTPSFLCVREAPSSKESVIHSPVQLVIPAEIREKSLVCYIQTRLLKHITNHPNLATSSAARYTQDG